MSNYRIGHFIVRNGRPNEQLTYDLFLSMKCPKQQVHIVCDDMDETLDTYKNNYGDAIIVFDKQKYIQTCDSGVQKPTGRHPTYARNACFDIAKQLGYTHIIIADDDIRYIHHRIVNDDKLTGTQVTNLPMVVEKCIDYMCLNEHIRCIGFGTPNSFIGGVNAQIFKHGMDYLIANLGIYDVNRPVTFVSECQEDLIASVTYTAKGQLMCVIPFLKVEAITEGRNGGGIVGHYDESNTFYRYFGSFIYMPASMTIKSKSGKITKKNKGNYIPMILSARWKK